MHTRSTDGLRVNARCMSRGPSDWRRVAKDQPLLGVIVPFALIIVLIVWLACNLAPAYVVSIAYACTLIFVFVFSRRWRLAAFLILFTSGPPFLEYELAWVVETATRRLPGLRSQITSMIFSAYDVLLLIGITVFVHKSIQRGNRPRLPIWLLYGISLLAVLGSASTINASLLHPESRLVLLAGYMRLLRPVATVLCVLGCWDNGSYNTETVTGLAAGSVLFLAQSLVVTLVKYGSITIGHTQFTGLIPGPGATGSFLVLVMPILLGIALHSEHMRQRRCYAAIGLLGILYIALTFSRAAAVGLLTAMIALIIISLRSKQETAKTMLLVMVACIISITILKYAASDYFIGKFYAMFEDSPLAYYNLQARTIYWSVGAELLKENWQLGIGPGMWGILATGYGTHAHNAYLQCAVELGAVAAIVIVVILLSSCMALVRYIATYSDALIEGEEFGLAAGMLAGLLGFMVTQLFETTLSNYRVTAVLWWIVAYAALVSTRKVGSWRKCETHPVY